MPLTLDEEVSLSLFRDFLEFYTLLGGVHALIEGTVTPPLPKNIHYLTVHLPANKNESHISHTFI